jgi:hypothetical protein
MKQEDLNKITKTVEGYLVKDLRWLQRDNIIVGLVKCPFLGRATYNEGFITCAWRKNGFTTNKLKGREDLNLKINLVD